jgi:hypothetical protein
VIIKMKKTVLTASLSAFFLLGMTSYNYAANTRTIRFIEDDAQKYMVSKVYELKHTKACDITPFVLGAVTRYYSTSKVSRLNYKYGKKQLLLVTNPKEMKPFVDCI